MAEGGFVQPRLNRSARWLLILVLLVVVVAAGGFSAFDGRVPIAYYRVIDPTHLVVGIQPGPSIWTRVASVSEDGSAVTVEVRSLRIPLAQEAGGNLIELPITLREPLADRRIVSVYDGSTPQSLKCPPSTGCP